MLKFRVLEEQIILSEIPADLGLRMQQILRHLLNGTCQNGSHCWDYYTGALALIQMAASLSSIVSSRRNLLAVGLTEVVSTLLHYRVPNY